MSAPAPAPTARVRSHALLSFALPTFAITWGVIGSYIFFPETSTARFGEIGGAHPLYFLATWAPPSPEYRWFWPTRGSAV